MSVVIEDADRAITQKGGVRYHDLAPPSVDELSDCIEQLGPLVLREQAMVRLRQQKIDE